MRGGNIMPRKKFLRRNWSKHSRLGKGRKKKQTWRRATGRHSKVRLKRKGYPIKVMIGFKQAEKALPKHITNIDLLKSMNKGEKVIIGKVGMKKKIEMLKIAKEKEIEVKNINITKMLKKVKEKTK
jgi:ribosomal protein L32E